MAKHRLAAPAACLSLFAGLVLLMGWNSTGDELERGFRNPPREARPHAYWLWLNGYVDPESARADLQAMKDAGFGGVLLFDMGARGDNSTQPPAGPAFLGPAWMKQFKQSVDLAKQLDLQVDVSVISSWDLGGHWIEPENASNGLYSTETVVEGGQEVDVLLPFPAIPSAAPRMPDGKPAFWGDVAVIGLHDAERLPGHDFVFRLQPDGLHALHEAVLDNGNPRPPADLAGTLTPTREFSVAVSGAGTREKDFAEVIRGSLPASAGAVKFAFPAGTRARYVRLRLMNGHGDRPRLTLAEFGVIDDRGVNIVAARVADRSQSGALMVRGTPSLAYDQEWNQENLHDGNSDGPSAVFASAGPPPLAVEKSGQVVDLTATVTGEGRLRTKLPPGRWTIVRFVCMNTGERLKVPSPASDGWATDHLSADATRAHMDYVVARLRETFGDVSKSGLTNLYLASYEVRGPIWSPRFTAEFARRRGYDMTRWMPALLGARVADEEATERFLFDYRKTLGEVLVDAYYRAAGTVAHEAGLGIKSEAGGPGPPVHNVPVDALLANSAVDEIQGEFWPFWPDADAMWVVKETAAAGHIYGKPRIHMEAFTSFEAWREGPRDLKPSADRVFCEGGNHMVWHTWSHVSPHSGVPGWAYGAGTHINRNVTWFPKVRPFVEYLSRASYLLQRGRFVADVLYYYGDGGYRFVGPRKIDPSLGRGYDYDVTNSDVILRRLGVKNGRLVLPDGTNYAILVLPASECIPPAVLDKIEELVRQGATVVGPKPSGACGLEGYPDSDRRVRAVASQLWGDLDGRKRMERSHGRGRVVWGLPLRDVLAAAGIPADVESPPEVDFIHRKDGEADIYFLRNTQPAAIEAAVSFRVTSRQPELWNPIDGQIAPAAVYRIAKDRVGVPVRLAPNGSTFVVFRRPASESAISEVNPPAEVVIRGDREILRTDRSGEFQVKRGNGTATRVRLSDFDPPIRLDDGWTIEFEPGRGAPARLTNQRLGSWTRQPDAAVRFFSGTAKYRKSFKIDGTWLKSNQRIYLDLGNLWTIGEIWLNRTSLGVAWTPPFRVDCTHALREGENELVVEVANTWYNRLAGDARLPISSRITRTNITSSGGQPWAALEPIDSGLLGPVRLLQVAERQIEW